MTTDQIEAERVAFEAALDAKCGPVNFRRDCTGGYEASWLCHEWRGWLMRAELIHAERQAAEELMERQESQRVAMAEKHERGE
jgi:hypothetical protein